MVSYYILCCSIWYLNVIYVLNTAIYKVAKYNVPPRVHPATNVYETLGWGREIPR